MIDPVHSMFPEVFGASRTDLQLSAFYETHRGNSRPSQTNFEYHPKQAQFKEQQRRATIETCSGTSGTAPAQLNPNQPVDNGRGVNLPPARRVVKLSIQPNATAWMVGTIAVVNVLVFVQDVALGHNAASDDMDKSPTSGFFWGTFLFLWTLVVLIQLVVCSVYVCTHFAELCAIMDLGVVLVASLVPREVFTNWIWLAPALCVVFSCYQCHLFWLIYTHSQNRRFYIAVIFVGTLVPLTQLFRAVDPVATTAGMSSRDVILSSIQISLLYITAFFNCYGAVVVDVTIGTSPLWTAGEAD
jgi:uncharacterized membrane protein